MHFVKDIDFDAIIPFNEQLAGFPKYLKDFGDSKAPNYCVADSKDLSKVYYPLVSGIDLLGFIEFDFVERLVIYTQDFWKLLSSVNFSKDVYVLFEDILFRYYSWADLGKQPVCFDVILDSKENWITCKNINNVSKDWTLKATKYSVSGKSTCSIIEPYIHTFLTTNNELGIIKTTRFIDTFPVIFFSTVIWGGSKEVSINKLDELESSEEPLNTFNLAFRVTNNDLCYLDVFDKNLELIEELFNFKNYIIKEVF